MKPVVQKAGAEGDIDTALEALSRQEVDALLVTADPFFNSRCVQGMALATNYAIRAIYQWPSSRRRAA
jgi:putative tryptophan/tyrosine transport system substrate-binding protein